MPASGSLFPERSVVIPVVSWLAMISHSKEKPGTLSLGKDAESTCTESGQVQKSQEPLSKMAFGS